MTSVIASGMPPIAAMVRQVTSRGVAYGTNGAVFAAQLLPTDPLGVFALTLTNIVTGSAIRIELAGSGALVDSRTASGASEVFNLQAYALASPNNNLRIKVRKGSAAPYYIPWETLATALVGAQSIYVSQIPDE